SQPHADGGEHITRTRRARRAEALESEDEKERRGEVGGLGDRRAAHLSALGLLGVLALNISSIRSVTTKPPTTLSVPKMTATKPSPHSSVFSPAVPSRMTPPMRTMP